MPGAGWVGLDPTSGLFAGEGHIPLACTPDPVSAAPITGRSTRARSNSSYATSCAGCWKTRASPNRTPTSNGLRSDNSGAAWTRSSRRGTSALPWAASRPSCRWTTWTAPSGTPRPRARTSASARAICCKRLKRRFAPGGLLHFGQGKWYPGEPLPRWALGCLWRTDGEAAVARRGTASPTRSAITADGEQRAALRPPLVRRLGSLPSAGPRVRGLDPLLWREACHRSTSTRRDRRAPQIRERRVWRSRAASTNPRAGSCRCDWDATARTSARSAPWRPACGRIELA